MQTQKMALILESLTIMSIILHVTFFHFPFLSIFHESHESNNKTFHLSLPIYILSFNSIKSDK
jgi:hypothetical protein